MELTKSDLTTGDELPGAHLKLTDEDGNVVDEWVSTEEAHVIKELVVGKTYTMTETKPADGYVTAESIEFTIENTAEIQKHEMKDDVTKVQISKTDITGDQEIPGAKLTILDENSGKLDFHRGAALCGEAADWQIHTQGGTGTERIYPDSRCLL